MKYKKLLVTLLALTTISSMYISFAFAGTGSIKIDPCWPSPTESPATFTTWVLGSDDAHSPRVLIVMTDACYQGMPDGSDVSIEWAGTITIAKGAFTMESINGDKIPDWATNGAKYTVASLKDHLGTSGNIWWEYVDVPGPMEVGKDYEFEVEIPSSEIRALVYVFGKSSSGAELWDMHIPPTPSGFVIPEVPIGTLMALASMLGTAGIYKIKRK